MVVPINNCIFAATNPTTPLNDAYHGGTSLFIGVYELRPYNYRIKPEPKYRPFKDAEECWQEMQKHQPFGWVKEISDGKYINLGWVPLEDNEDAFHSITFADGSVFGVEKEE